MRSGEAREARWVDFGRPCTHRSMREVAVQSISNIKWLRMMMKWLLVNWTVQEEETRNETRSAFRPARCRKRTRTPLASIRGGLVDGDDDSNSTTPRRTLPPDLVSVGSSRPQNGADSERAVTVDADFLAISFLPCWECFEDTAKIESFELGEGNWVNLRYETAQQAKLALSRDRGIVEGSVAITE